jgi:transposase
MGETLRMSRKERTRLVELGVVKRGDQTLARAARRLGLSYRQMKRIWHRFQSEGEAGLVHRSRGRPSNRKKPERLRQKCLAMYRERLEGFGPTLASEKLAASGLEIDHETLRRWLIAEGLWKRRRRRSKHRRWRPRRKHFGELVQFDASPHDWFGRGEPDCLMGMIDDATGRRRTWMSQQETTADAMRLLWLWIERYGIPRALYADRKSVYVTDREPTLEEQLAGEEPLTVFGRACHKLGIEIISAHSAQAKGRIERCHGVYQDRLVKEIRLQQLSCHDEVNAVLEAFDEDLNRRFAVEPTEVKDFHRRVPKGLDLADVFVWESTRTVHNDWTVRYQNRWYQIIGPKRRLPPAKSKVAVLRRLDGTLQILYRDRSVDFELLAERPKPATKAKPAPKSSAWRPAPDHPWRRPISRRAPSLEAR